MNKEKKSNPILGLLVLLALPLLFGVGLGTFIMLQVFQLPLATSLVFAFAAFIAFAALLFGSDILLKRWQTNFSSRQSIGLTKAESTELNKQMLRESRRAGAHQRALHTQKTFFGNAFLVGTMFSIFAWVLYNTMGLYPSEVFFVPLYVLAILWFFLLFYNRLIVIIVALLLMLMSVLLLKMGPQMLIYILPYALMFPLMMFMNFFIMFGPLAAMNIMQLHASKPGDADFGVTLDDVRGQDTAKQAALEAVRKFVAGSEDELLKRGGKRERGILLVGPPGTGKTMLAKAIAAQLNRPIIITTGAAFQATFIGIDILTVLVLRFWAEFLAGVYKGCLVFIDECETLLHRPGVMTGQESHNVGTLPPPNPWSAFSYDEFGSTSSCGLVYDFPEARMLFWEKKFPIVHPQMMPFMGGMGGGSNAIMAFLPWMDGIDTAPFLTKLWRNKVNQILDVLFVPPELTIRNRDFFLRVPAGKPHNPPLLFVGATNRPQMIDPAMLRPGRFGRSIPFVTPGEKEREDIIDGYMPKIAHDPQLDAPEMRAHLARAFVGLSPAQIEQVLRDGITYRFDFIEKLRELKIVEAKGRIDTLDESTRRFWEAHRDECTLPGWDKIEATWESMMEALGAIRYGTAKPTRTNKLHRETTAVHEVKGHILPLKYFCGNWMRPTTLSILPRGDASGMVAHVPIEEHDPRPQAFFEGLVCMSLGSLIAERMTYGDNQPGVVSDLENATSLASQMVGMYGMVPRACTKEEYLRYKDAGLTVFSSAGDPMSHGQERGSGGSPDKRAAAYVILGQCFVATWRLLRKNEGAEIPIIKELLEKDEIVGKDLERVWNNLHLKPLTEADEHDWSDEGLERIIQPPSRFYKGE